MPPARPRRVASSPGGPRCDARARLRPPALRLAREGPEEPATAGRGGARARAGPSAAADVVRLVPSGSGAAVSPGTLRHSCDAGRCSRSPASRPPPRSSSSSPSAFSCRPACPRGPALPVAAPTASAGMRGTFAALTGTWTGTIAENVQQFDSHGGAVMGLDPDTRWAATLTFTECRIGAACGSHGPADGRLRRDRGSAGVQRGADPPQSRRPRALVDLHGGGGGQGDDRATWERST